MKQPVLDHDIVLPPEPDMQQVVSALRGHFPAPDLYLWVESVPGYYPKRLEVLKCPKACYLIDTHLHLDWHLEWAKRFDFVFVAQREYVSEFQCRGFANVHWLPLACDSEIHSNRGAVKRFDVGFVGSVFEGSRRAELLNQIRRRGLFLKVERCFWDEMALVFSESRIVFNNAVRNDLNMRVFEAMSTGSFLLTDAAKNSGLNELFKDGEDLAIYEDSGLLDRIRLFLIREEEREHIAARGQKMVRQAHTYGHRTDALLQLAFRERTRTPTADEWRERSLTGLARSGKWHPSRLGERPEGRSYIIPVIDATPEGRREFGDLLDDLKELEGEVIVIFNSADAAASFKDDPRIDLSASLNVNVGVARAWNIGVHMASQPTLFFLNADLRVSAATIKSLEASLWELPSAAIVGPEGSYFGFYTYEDIFWFHHGVALDAPRAVDAVSGFLFATKRDLFLRKILQFEDRFTPCFTEEWDLGLQAKQAGYKCYVVPVKDYRHEWGVSADPDRVITYLKGKQSKAAEIVARNRIQFWRKWLAIAGQFAMAPAEPNGPDMPPSNPANLLQSLIGQELEHRPVADAPDLIG